MIFKKSGASSTENKLCNLAFENSSQANIITTAGNGKIIMVNNAACKLLGYSKKEILTKCRASIFDITETSFKNMLEQRTAEGHSEALVTAIKKNGKLFTCEITSAVFTDDDGIEKAITTVADMSRSILNQQKVDIKKEKIVADNIVLAQSVQKEIDTKKDKVVAANIKLALVKSDEEKRSYETITRIALLTEYEDRFKFIFNSTSDVFYDSDLVTNKVLVSEAYEKEFGYTTTSNMTPVQDWISHIHPDDKEDVLLHYNNMLASKDTEWNCGYRFLRADNSIANVISNGVVLRDADGKASRIIGCIHDISKQRVLEERLEVEIRLKEKQIAVAMDEAKETERSDIGKELHDNINQLLAASRMFLEMAKRGGAESELYLNRSSEYTLTAIEEIRKLTKGLTNDIITNFGLCDAIDNVTQDTMEVNRVKISCALHRFNEYSVHDKFKLNVYRIVQEQLNNIIKHARAKKVSISLSQNKLSIMLIISDNGVGFDTAQKNEGIGLDNIKSRAASYNGTADFNSQPGQGCILTVMFPVTDALQNKN